MTSPIGEAPDRSTTAPSVEQGTRLAPAGILAVLFISLAVPGVASAQYQSWPVIGAEYHDAGTLDVSWTGDWPGYHIIHCEASPGGSCVPDHSDTSNHIGHISALSERGNGIWNKCSANWSDDEWATDFSCILDGLDDGSTHCFKLGDLGEGNPTYFSNIGCGTVKAPSIPSVSLTASPNPVEEGQSVTITARLSEALSNSVTIPLSLASGTAESGDYGSLASITVAGGQTTGTGTITTAEDADRDDETFTVSLGVLPSELSEGEPSSVEVTIRDDDDPPPDRPPPDDPPPDDPPPDNQPPPPDNQPPPPDDPLTVQATCEPCTVLRGGEVRLKAAASDPDGDPISYDWNADSGMFIGPTDEETARWQAPDLIGSFQLRVLVSNGSGDSASASVVVRVTNAAPAFEEYIYAFELPEKVDGRGEPVELGGVRADDPDGDELTYELVSGEGERFVIGARDGVLSYVGPGEDFATEPNEYELTARVLDEFSAKDLTQVIVTVTNVNDAPVAVDDDAETPEDETVTLDVLANDADPDGDPLRVTSVSAPAHGTVRVGSEGGVTYTPDPDYHGPDLFTYVVSDGGGLSDTASVAIEVLPVNDAPVAEDDGTEIPEDGAVTLDVLANDADPDGDPLRVTSVSAPAHGTVRVASDGGVTYTPSPDYHGPDLFTYVVSDGGGLSDTASVAVSVLPVNDAPVTVLAIPDQALDEGGGAVEMDMTPFFKDIDDGEALKYYASSSNTDVVGTAVAGTMLTLTPVVHGSAAVTVTAEDRGGLTAVQTFTVAVDDRPVRTVMGYTLAAMARGHIASSRMTLARRVDAGGRTGSKLSLMGRPVPLDREAAVQMLAGCATGASRSGGGVHDAAGIAGCLDFGIDPGAPLRGVEFELALDRGRRTGRSLALWGQGDIQTFDGAAQAAGFDASYDGDLSTAYAGVDARLTDRWLTGLAVSRSRGEGSWATGSSSGRLTTTLTALHPYVRWSDGVTSVWTMGGGGLGRVENVREPTGFAESSDLRLRLGLAEVRRRVAGGASGAAFGLRADAAWADLRTADGGESVDGHATAVDQQRFGVELLHRMRLGALFMVPSGEVHARRDGGAGQTGHGLEVAGGLRAAAGMVRLEARGRLLAMYSTQDYRERGAAVTLAVGGASSGGPGLSVSSRWGDSATVAGALWQDEFRRTSSYREVREPWALDAGGHYGMRLGHRLLYWSAALSRSDDRFRLTVGVRLHGQAR